VNKIDTGVNKFVDVNKFDAGVNKLNTGVNKIDTDVNKIC